MGSPSLLVWQPPPKPDQSELPAVGPATSAPVDLLNTAKDSFTHWTYCVAPTAPLVSGGAELIVNPSEAFPKPSKPKPRAGARVAGANAAVCWWAISGSLSGFSPTGRGMWRTGSASL